MLVSWACSETPAAIKHTWGLKLSHLIWSELQRYAPLLMIMWCSCNALQKNSGSSFKSTRTMTNWQSSLRQNQQERVSDWSWTSVSWSLSKEVSTRSWFRDTISPRACWSGSSCLSAPARGVYTQWCCKPSISTGRKHRDRDWQECPTSMFHGHFHAP